MLSRFINEWRALPVGDKRRIIVMGIEMLIEGGILFGGFVSFLLLAAALADKITGVIA